jgi:hypothetical protein
MRREDVFAYTEPGASYPGYVNVSTTPMATYAVTLRSPGMPQGHSIELPAAVVESMVRILAQHMGLKVL